MNTALATQTPTQINRLTLYELGDEQIALDEIYEMDEGEVTDAHLALETELIEKLALKADSFGGYVRSLESTADAIKQEEERLHARRKALEKRADRLKSLAMVALVRMQRLKVEGTRFTLAVQNNPASVAIDCLPGALPAAFVRVIPEQLQPDKALIAKALKAGEVIEGARLVQTQSLRIR